MKKTVVIHQPDFMPYLGFFHRLLYADEYIILDDVQYVSGTSKSWMNRDLIKTINGEKWITVTVKKAPKETKINQIEINYMKNWQNQHLELLKQNYKKAPYFKEIFIFIEELYSQKYTKLVDFNVETIKMLVKLFDIKIDMTYSHTLTTTKTKSERLVELLTQVNATHYLSGVGARDYHIQSPFDDNSIKVVWQDFAHPVYEQQFEGFIPYLSSIDLLFNSGIKDSRKILRSC